MFRLYGITPTADGSLQYSDWSEAVLPEDLPEIEHILMDTVSRSGQSRCEFRIRRRNDGEVRDIECAILSANEQGQAEWVVGTNLDVTERKRAESALLESRRKLQLGIDVAAFAIAEVDYVAHTIELSPDAA